MTPETNTIAQYAKASIRALIEAGMKDTWDLFESPEPILIATHFRDLRGISDEIALLAKKLEAHVEELNRHSIPDLFLSRSLKTLKVIGLGRVTVASKWTASMLDPIACRQWLKEHDAAGLIIETVSAPALTREAKYRALAGNPLPDELFKVGTSNYVSISKG